MVVVELGLHQKIEQVFQEVPKRRLPLGKNAWLQEWSDAKDRVLALVDEDRRERQEQLRKLLAEFPSIHQNSALRGNSVVRGLIEDYEKSIENLKKELLKQ